MVAPRTHSGVKEIFERSQGMEQCILCASHWEKDGKDRMSAMEAKAGGKETFILRIKKDETNVFLCGGALAGAG